jgi:hypothetical protein
VNYKAEKQGNKIKITKTAEKIKKDKSKKLKEIEVETLEELIDAVKKIAAKTEIKVEFTFDKIK